MVIENINTEYLRYRIPVLVRTNDGILIGAYECRNEESDWGHIDIKIISSEDDGKTWKTLHLIKGDGQTLNNPVFIVKDNVLHFLYCKNYRHLFYTKSLDNGKTFEKEREITDIFDKKAIEYTIIAVGPSHGTHHKGVLLAPVWFAYNKNDLKSHFPSFISTIYSTDDGKTWGVGEIIGENMFKNPSECSLSKGINDEVLISIRNEDGGVENNFRAFASSPNGFSNWNTPEFYENMRDTICQGALFNDGKRVYHINCINGDREYLTIKASSDNFKTFSSFLVDEIGGYSDFFVYNNVAYVLYERRPWQYGLQFKKIKLD